ncbi:Integrator complex subunit 3 [Myotis brandtii]|uniref:Integrator complex subunit 3 n=1 Tax=Myotis brandtii TaxID=109478 RepID=S7NGV2_MYOBR|nr:Integrator complex subunit 3 [Myotis brandtii]
MKQESCWPITSVPAHQDQQPPSQEAGSKGLQQQAGPVALEQTLEHLDNLPLNLTNTKWNFLSQAPVPQALQQVQASCDEPTQ